MGTRNVTIVLEEEVARWARVAAAERDTSLSRFLGGLVRQQMLEERDYKAAMRAFLAVKPAPRKEPGPYPRRDEIHQRVRRS